MVTLGLFIEGGLGGSNVKAHSSFAEAFLTPLLFTTSTVNVLCCVALAAIEIPMNEGLSKTRNAFRKRPPFRRPGNRT